MDYFNVVLQLPDEEVPLIVEGYIDPVGMEDGDVLKLCRIPAGTKILSALVPPGRLAVLSSPAMGQPPLDTSRPDLSRPTDPELQPVEPYHPRPDWWLKAVAQDRRPPVEPPFFYRRGNFKDRLTTFVPTFSYEPPCSPTASQPVAELAEPSAPSREGSATAGGARFGRCCSQMRSFGCAPLRTSGYREKTLESDLRFMTWSFCPWCGVKLTP